MARESKPLAVYRRPLGFVFKLAIGLGLVVWLVRSGRLDLAALARIPLGSSLVGVAFGVGAMLLFPLFRWRLLLRAQRVDPGLAKTARILAAGYFANTFLPAGLGIEGVRLAYLGRLYPGRLAAVASTQVVDRLLGLVSLLALGGTFASLALVGGSGPEAGWERAWPILMVSGLVVAAGLAGLIWIGTRPASSPLERIPGWSALAAPCRETLGYREHPRVLVAGFLLSMAGHLGMVAAAYFSFRCLGETPRPWSVLAIAPGVNLAGALPLAPLGLGVADATAEALYPLVGLSGGAEAVMLTRFLNLALSLVCGLALLLPEPVYEHKGTA